MAKLKNQWKLQYKNPVTDDIWRDSSWPILPTRSAQRNECKKAMSMTGFRYRVVKVKAAS